MNATIALTRADYADPRDGEALVALLDAYARDPMGGGEGLAPEAREALVQGLADTPGAFSLIAWDESRGDEDDGQAVGLVNCFTAFSTFAGRRLVNIHDIVVLPPWRGKGIARALLAAVEEEARRLGACKLTLEVLSGNDMAKALYASQGFGDYTLRPEAAPFDTGPLETSHALFWQKRLT